MSLEEWRGICKQVQLDKQLPVYFPRNESPTPELDEVQSLMEDEDHVSFCEYGYSTGGKTQTIFALVETGVHSDVLVSEVSSLSRLITELDAVSDAEVYLYESAETVFKRIREQAESTEDMDSARAVERVYKRLDDYHAGGDVFGLAFDPLARLLGEAGYLDDGMTMAEAPDRFAQYADIPAELWSCPVVRVVVTPE